VRLFHEAASASVRDAVHALVKGWPGVEARTMMGCPGWRVHGSLIASVIDGGVVLHTLSPEESGAARRELGGGPFRPTAARSVASWLVVPLAADQVRRVEPWLRACYERAKEKGKKGKVRV